MAPTDQIVRPATLDDRSYNESLGLVAGELLHEICNAFTAVKHQADSAANESGLDGKTKNALLASSQASERVLTIAKALLNSLRSIDTNTNTTHCNVHDVVSAAILAVATPDRVTTEIIGDSGTIARVHPFILEHVIVNILLNAIAAAPRGAETIVVSFGTVQASKTNGFTWNNEAQCVEIVVSDNGHGILAHGVSTPKQRRYGLSVCKKLLATVHGTLTISPNTGRGTSVRVVLPVAHPNHRLPNAA